MQLSLLDVGEEFKGMCSFSMYNVSKNTPLRTKTILNHVFTLEVPKITQKSIKNI